MKEYLKAKLSSLPTNPGCYIMKDKNNNIIYVGKAKKLKNRVNQYFVGKHDFKTTKMVSLINDFEYIITDSEKEALVLEYNLIKKHKPRYNIMFIDDKSYPYIKLTNEKYPILSVVRDIKKDKKSKYFGPFPDASAAHNTLKILQEIYPFRKCKTIPKKVCLYYHINQCLGPCEFDIKDSVYIEMSEKVLKFLKGDVKEVVDDLNKKMLIASENLEFEKAKEFADKIKSINHITTNQQVSKDDNYDRDVFAYFFDKGYIAIQGFLIRGGNLIEREFKLLPLYGDADEEFTSFLLQYYENHIQPKELVLDNNIDIEALSQILKNIKIVQNVKGYRKKLIDMCILNAKNKLELKFDIVEKQISDTLKANNQLNKLLNREITRIELFDNSHISGNFTVGAMVVYEDGQPSKKNYRLFKLTNKNNDTDSMKEILYRRFHKALMENSALPDCIILDGGINQINSAKEILKSLNIEILILGLVKDNTHTTNCLMDSDGNIFDIKKDSELFFLLTRMQDEVHRVAITYHKKLRLKAQTKSILDEIEGVGEIRKKKLLSHFKSFKAIKQASVEELSEVVNKDVALKIYDFLKDMV